MTREFVEALLDNQAQLGLSDRHVVVILHIARYQWWDSQMPFPSVSTVAGKKGTTRKNVQLALRELDVDDSECRVRALRRIEQDGKTSFYDLSPLCGQLGVQVGKVPGTCVENDAPPASKTTHLPASKTTHLPASKTTHEVPAVEVPAFEVPEGKRSTARLANRKSQIAVENPFVEGSVYHRVYRDLLDCWRKHHGDRPAKLRSLDALMKVIEQEDPSDLLRTMEQRVAQARTMEYFIPIWVDGRVFLERQQAGQR